MGLKLYHMEKEIILTGSHNGQIALDYTPSINYAMVLNGHRAINKFTLRNTSKEAWRNVSVSLSGEVVESIQQDIPMLKPGKTVSLDEFSLMPVVTKLMALTECVQTSFCITIVADDEQIAKHSFLLSVMAFNQWHGFNTMPELLASFVTPNHPKLLDLTQRASAYLGHMTGNASLDDYQSGSKLRVASQIEAVYNALKDESLNYLTVPASFETTGQRIRLIDQIINGKQGNCLDLSVLLCSCMESIGLHTIIALFDTHAVMGVWTEQGVITPMVGYDVKFLREAVKNNHQLTLIDATALTAGATMTEAISSAESYLEDHAKQFNIFVDIQSARNQQVRPLPHCILTETGWVVEEDNPSLTRAPQLEIDIHGTVSPDKLKSKQLLWERKLLDLTLRNNLLNMKLSNSIVPFLKEPVDEILKSLKGEQLLELLDTKDMLAASKELYRASRNSLEENGANTLFLAIGTLKWYEEGADTPHLAPVVFLPVEMVRQSSKKYVARLRDDEPLVNITLFEMLRQNFEMDMPETCRLLEQENATVQWKAILAELAESIKPFSEGREEDNRWEVIENCHLGIFSFTKFVMWNDIHSHPEVLEAHHILQSLIEGRSVVTDKADDIDARSLDKTARPSDYAIPLDVDSSQLEAIVKSGKGQSFILYGPPGTGKSQTITNMIANALYQDKRVLFVAEKKAALEVVQERLKRIGLAPFCLELHSNKVEKKAFLAQMDEAANIDKAPQHPFFQQHSDELFAKRSELNASMDALHRKRQQGLSLYEYINRYLDIKGEILPLSYAAIKHIDLNKLTEIQQQFEAMDKVIDILGEHPTLSPLKGLYPLHNTLENQNEVTRLLALLPSEITKAKKKADGWINRWFMKKTALEILNASDIWEQFCNAADMDEDIKSNFDTLEASIGSWNSHIDKLRLWYHYSERALRLKACDVPAGMTYFLQGHSGKETSDAFTRGYYLRMSMGIIEEDPALRTFNGMLFEDIIKQFRSQSKHFQQLTIDELRHRLTSRIAEVENDKKLSEELTTLRKRISNHGRGTSVRKILEQTKGVLPKLCPCMLMSPLSVSQYLEMQAGLFDLVIFDEASQMPTSEAVGAIARGKAVVVVGDPKQMPPTSFFMANNTTDEDVDVDDLESILEDCISLSLPHKYLSWHYRSKHESLIAFSNIHFYDGKLTTFPSVDDQERKVSLQYVDGTYDFGKSRSNRSEAKAIVDEVISRLRSELPVEDGGEQKPHRSIGIVAFNKNQSNLIEDLLMEALAKDRRLEEIALKSDEPVFIKNLENVQGDERDVILFSVGYGPDKSGKVSMNFGPLNQVGGERRLNVAVSRARYEMKVFSTLHPHQIDLQRTNALGVRGLKRFLEYAGTGILPCPASQLPTQDAAPIVQQIASRLQAEGYEVHTGIGSSRFNVDIAIVDKENLSRYLMGIIVDTDNYYATPTASDREIVQPDILSSLGWQLHHVWSVDWLENSDRCIKLLKDRLEIQS